MNEHNRRRALAEVVTAEAWHKAFAEGRTRADLHVDVVFGIGRISGGEGSGVRFRLGLKRADIVVILPELEPVKVDPETVRRDAAKPVTGKIEIKTKVSKSVGLAVGCEVGASAKGVKAAAKAKADVALAASKNRTLMTTQTFSGLQVTQNQTPEKDYRWVLEPAIGQGVLSGRPWDAKRVPRLQLVDQRRPGSNSMAPTVRVEVRCLREDLEISNIILDDAPAWALIRRRQAAETRRVAAEAAIRTLLTEAGLAVGDMTDPLATITIAMTTADVL
jgi:hypothetical protein